MKRSKKVADLKPVGLFPDPMLSEVVKLWEWQKDGTLDRVRNRMREWFKVMPWMFAVDPGPHESAVVTIENGQPQFRCKLPNSEIKQVLHTIPNAPIVIEMVASYGMPVGAEVFDTCVEIGRMIAYHGYRGVPVFLMRRADVKLQLCRKTVGITDAVMRQRMIDEYGGKEAAVGTKKHPGPVHGFSKDTWQALALGVAFRQIVMGTHS